MNEQKLQQTKTGTDINEEGSITFYGGAGTVTGSNFLLTLGGTQILIDCGLVQGVEYCDDCNYEPFKYNPSEIDFLFVTHAHADHIGRVPKLVKEGFNGIIYSTPATKDMSVIMFTDSVKIIAREAKEEGREPMYSSEDVAKTLSLWKTIPYRENTALQEGISAYLKDAGHILGSSIIEFSYKGKKIVFTGDLGNSPSPLLKDTESVTDANYMVMESVYGDRNHEEKGKRVEKLKQAIIDISAKRGVLLIPSFSIERTQVLLYEINTFFEEKKIPPIPVFLDSPLAIKVTDIYRRYTNLFNEEVQNKIKEGDDIFDFPKFKMTPKVAESKKILDAPNPKIIIAGSGMSSGGRILHHEKAYLSDKKSILLLVGYQAVGTMGRKIQDGLKEVIINGVPISIKAEVRIIHGFSAHKDLDNLISFVENTQESIEKVFVAMGEPKASLFLVQRLRDYLGVDAVSPKKGESYTLDL